MEPAPLKFRPPPDGRCVYKRERTWHVIKKKKKNHKNCFIILPEFLKRVTVTLNRHNTAVKKRSVCVCSALPLIETGPMGSYYSRVAQSETPTVNDRENSGSEASRD